VKINWTTVAAVLVGLIIGFSIYMLAIGGRSVPNEIDEANSIVDSLLKSLRQGDYKLFSKHFSNELRKEFPEESFWVLRSYILNKLGSPTKAEYTYHIVNGNETLVVYKVLFTECEEGVKLKIVFTHDDGKLLIKSFAFDLSSHESR